MLDIKIFYEAINDNVSYCFFGSTNPRMNNSSNAYIQKCITHIHCTRLNSLIKKTTLAHIAAFAFSLCVKIYEIHNVNNLKSNVYCTNKCFICYYLAHIHIFYIRPYVIHLHYYFKQNPLILNKRKKYSRCKLCRTEISHCIRKYYLNLGH